METRPPARPAYGLRRLLARFSQALLVYGGASLLVAVVGFGGIIWASLTAGGLSDRIARESAELATTLRRTATVLDDASSTAESFGRTLAQTPPGVRQAAAAVRNLQPRLQALEAQAGGINILGSRPLAGLGELFGRMAADLAGLDAQLDRIADELTGNQASLEENADSLAALADRMEAFAVRVDEGLITAGMGEVRTILILVLVLLVVGMAVPAVGALSLGWWLRRELGLGRPKESVIVVVER